MTLPLAQRSTMQSCVDRPMATGLAWGYRLNSRSIRDELTVNGAVNSYIISTLARRGDEQPGYTHHER